MQIIAQVDFFGYTLFNAVHLIIILTMTLRSASFVSVLDRFCCSSTAYWRQVSGGFTVCMTGRRYRRHTAQIVPQFSVSSFKNMQRCLLMLTLQVHISELLL